MRRSRLTRCWPGRALASVSAAWLLALASPAVAGDAPGGPALRQARAAWERGTFVTAETLYREAIERGGLAPDELLEGYVRLGAIRANAGKKDKAVASFRIAALLDAGFVPPTEAGPSGPQLAAQAKRDVQKFGSLKLTVDLPKEAPAGKPLKVTAHVDTAHLSLVAKVGFSAKDGTSGKDTARDTKPEETMEFEIPGELALPSATITVKVDALDVHQNRLASFEDKVRVEGGPTKEADAGATKPSIEPSNPLEYHRRTSFWSTPWPYLIGGIALAGAGTAVYFGTRSPEVVTIGSPDARTR